MYKIPLLMGRSELEDGQEKETGPPTSIAACGSACRDLRRAGR
ncbi:hypothetical protein F8B43_4600 [Methylorubrum populi]|uniref:Uncharacterized protein n=1 Tax=Methylorubrum populi TaxID=223967 RepID=A0A833J4A0_9HYPH|nr:hypothetical protein F8B43_4600 [Methylorubrum populi]